MIQSPVRNPQSRENPFRLSTETFQTKRGPRSASIDSYPYKRTPANPRVVKKSQPTVASQVLALLDALPVKRWAGLLLIGMVLFLMVWPGLFKNFTVTAHPVVKTLPPLPVQYSYISSPFGWRWGRQHQGVDFAAPLGTPIHAASSGTVVFSGWESGYGKSIILEHDHSRQTRYAHCSRLLAGVGSKIEKGQTIGLVGSTGHSTGPHLHFEVLVDGERKNPAWYYQFDGKPVQIAISKKAPLSDLTFSAQIHTVMTWLQTVKDFD